MKTLKFFLLAVVSVPLLPLMYFQGKRIRSKVPSLPEALEPEGKIQRAGVPIKIIAIGESTVAGVGVKTHSEGFTGSLAAAIAEKFGRSVNYKVNAQSGFSAKKVHRLLLPKFEEEQADLLIIGLGGNDAFELNFPWNFQKEAKTLIEKLQKRFPGTPIVFLNMPPIKEFPAFTSLIKFVIGNLVELHGEFLQNEVLKHENVYFDSRVITFDDWIDLFPGNLTTNDFFSDGVHPSGITYQIWAKEICQFIIDKKILN